MTDFTANFTLSEVAAIDATFVITPLPSKLSELTNDANYVQDASYVHTDNNFTDILLNNLNNQSGINTGDITVTDSSEINFDLIGQNLTASIKSGSIDEIKLNSSVNASLDKADSALQSFTETDPVYTADKSFIALKSELPTATSDLTNDSGFITSADVPTTLAELTGDSTHRLVTDVEKSTWNGKQDALGYTPEDVANKLDEIIEDPKKSDYYNAEAVNAGLDEKANDGVVVHLSGNENISGTKTFNNLALTVQTLTDGSTIDWDMNNGGIGIITLTSAGRTLNSPSNIAAGGLYKLIIKQDSTGSRTITTWGSYFKFPGGVKPVLSATANAIDIVEFFAESSSVLHLINLVSDLQ